MNQYRGRQRRDIYIYTNRTGIGTRAVKLKNKEMQETFQIRTLVMTGILSSLIKDHWYALEIDQKMILVGL